MTATLRPSHADGNGGRDLAAAKESRWGNGKADPIAAGVARRLGIAPKTAEHLLRALPDKVVACVEEFDAQGAELRRERFTRRILAALERRTAPPLCDATFDLSQRADSAEEVAETAFNRDPSAINRDRLIRASEEELRWQEARLLALYADRARSRRERT